jgi:ribokinase
VLTGIEVRDFVTARRAAESLLECGPRIAVVQAGDEGDLLLARDEAVRLPRLPVSMVDPTGGGDALVASLVVLLAQGMKLEPAGRLAAAAAAHTVSHLGGRPTYADRGELAAMYDREFDS